MVDVQKFCNALKSRPKREYRYLYHFTETTNLESIKGNGLLSLEKIEAAKFTNIKYMSSVDSRTIDKYKKLHRYVHLCLYPEHPMEFAKRWAGESDATSWIKVNPDVVLQPGVLFSAKMSNANDAEIKALADIGKSDFDYGVVFKFADWSDPDIRDRLQKTKKYEILIPDSIPTGLLTF